MNLLRLSLFLVPLLFAIPAAKADAPEFVCKIAGDRVILGAALNEPGDYEFSLRDATGDFARDCDPDYRATDVSPDVQSLSCRFAEGRAIVLIATTDGSGDRIILRKESAAGHLQSCGPNKRRGDVLIGDASTVFNFEGVAKGRLLLTIENGSVGDLALYDLVSGKEVLRVPGGEIIDFGPDALDYWQNIGRGTPATCKDYAALSTDGAPVAIATRMSVDLSSLKTTKTQQTRCGPGYE